MPHLSPMNWFILFLFFWILTLTISMMGWWTPNIDNSFSNPSNKSTNLTLLPW